MSINILATPLAGLKVVELKVHGDDRGFLIERFNRRDFEAAGLPVAFVQDNHSRSAPGVIRGLHYQYQPAQGKLVGVARGAILDVAVDIRPESPNFGQHFAIELSDVNGRMLWVPAGFAHGYCVIGTEVADVLYKVDALYNPACEAGIAWNDPDLGIRWPVDRPLVSKRDQEMPSFQAYRQKPATFV